MFWLIETEEKLREFREKKFKKVFVEIVSLNNKIHPTFILHKMTFLVFILGR